MVGIRLQLREEDERAGVDTPRLLSSVDSCEDWVKDLCMWGGGEKRRFRDVKLNKAKSLENE